MLEPVVKTLPVFTRSTARTRDVLEASGGSERALVSAEFESERHGRLPGRIPGDSEWVELKKKPARSTARSQPDQEVDLAIPLKLAR